MRYLFILLFIPFSGFSQTDSYYSNGARRPHIRVDSLTANKTDSIKIGDKMFYSMPPTLTEAGDIVHLSHLNNALAGISLDSTNYWRTKSDFNIYTDIVIEPTVNNAHDLNFGNLAGNRFSSFNLRTGTDFNNFNDLRINSSGLALINTNSGNQNQLSVNNSGVAITLSGTNTFGGVADYSSNYTDLSYIQRGFANSNYWPLSGDGNIDNSITYIHASDGFLTESAIQFENGALYLISKSGGDSSYFFMDGNGIGFNTTNYTTHPFSAISDFSTDYTNNSYVSKLYTDSNYWNSQINTTLTGSAITIQQPTSNYDFDFQIGDASTGTNGTRLRVEDHTGAADRNAALVFGDSSRWSIINNFPSGLNLVMTGNDVNSPNKSAAIGTHSDGNVYVGRQSSVFSTPSFGGIMYLENYHANWQDGDNGGTITRDRVVPDIGFIEDSIASKYIPLEGNIVTTDQLIIGVQDNNQLTIQNEAGSSAWQITTIGTNRTVYDIKADSVGTNVHFSIGVDSTSFQDNRTVKRGIEYSQPGIYATKDGSLTDRLTVANMISDSLAVSGTVIREELVNLGAWNMSSATGSLSLAVDISSLNIPVDTAILNVEVTVIHDGGNASYQFLEKLDVAGSCTTCGSVDPFSSNISITINNESGGFFDSVDFDRTDKNRGYMIVKWREEN